MFEKILFNILAFTLFILIFFKLVKKNDTSYVYLLVAQFIGIVINFIELSFGRSFGIILKFVMYVLSILIPILIILLERKKNIEFAEISYLTMVKIMKIFNKSNDAKQLLIKLTEKCPNSYKGHKLLADIYMKDSKFELALEEYQKVYEIDPSNKEIYLKIGKLYENIGKEDEAISVFSTILKQKPDYYEASILLADILNNKREYKEAVQVYMNALRYRPNDYDLYYNLGITYTMLNDFAKAKENYERAAQINTNLYHAKYSLGQLNLIYGDLEEAEKYFIDCIDIDIIEANAYYYLARISMIRGETDKAKNYANIAIGDDPEIYNKMLDENIFLPIMKYINKPNNSLSNKRKSLTKKEMEVDKHLDNTCKLVGKLNNYDIEMIENIKKTNKNSIKEYQDIQRDDIE